jgi:hypothetical protein
MNMADRFSTIHPRPMTGDKKMCDAGNSCTVILSLAEKSIYQSGEKITPKQYWGDQ